MERLGPGPRRILGLLGEGLRTRPYLGRSQRSGKVGGYSAVAPAPRRLQVGAPGRGPLALVSRLPRSCGTSLPALFIFQRAEPRSARRSVSPSVRARVRAPPHSMAAPRGPHPLTPAPPPGARRTPSGAQGQWGRRTRAFGAGRGEGRGGTADAGRAGRWPGQRAASRSLGLRAGRRASGCAGREPPGWAGPCGRGGEGARLRRAGGGGQGVEHGVASARGSQLGAGRAALWPPRLCLRCRRASAPS